MLSVRASRGILFLAALAVVLLGVTAGHPAQAATQTLLPYQSDGYRYLVVQHNSDPGFESPAFDDSAFSTGGAPFGTGGYCPIESTVRTAWPSNTDLLLRRTVSVPAGATGVTVEVAIDNEIAVFWNGVLIGGPTLHDGCATDDSQSFSIPAADVHPGDNLLAFRAIDLGDLDYFDATVVATGPSLAISASAVSDSAPYTPGTWTRHDVDVSFSCTSLAAITSVTGPVDVSADGAGQSVTGSCADAAGASASTTFSGIDIDKTPPSVTWSSHPATYDVDQTVLITCAASDALSGLAGSTCSNIAGPGYSFPLGLNTFSATATDHAGNSTTAATSFTVAVTEAGLCRLIGDLEPQAGIANSLCVKLAAASAAEARGDQQARAGAVEAFDLEVSAQVGTTLSASGAALLEQLAGSI